MGVGGVTLAANRRGTPGPDVPPSQRLLRAAEELFGERSYWRTTVADICARAGIATGSFYAHFDSKAAIFTAVVRQINEDLRKAIRTAIETAGTGSGNGSGPASAPSSRCCRSGRGSTGSCARRSSSRPRCSASTTSTSPGATARGVRQAQLNREVDARYDPEVIAYMYTGHRQLHRDAVGGLDRRRPGARRRGRRRARSAAARPPAAGPPIAARIVLVMDETRPSGRFPRFSPTRHAGTRTASGCGPTTAR